MTHLLKLCTTVSKTSNKVKILATILMTFSVIWWSGVLFYCERLCTSVHISSRQTYYM